MKNLKTIQLIACSLFLLGLLIACETKDADAIIIDNFDYTLETVYEGEGLIFKEVKTSLTIVPETYVTTVEYGFRYEMLSGKGYFKDIYGDSIAIDTQHSMDSIYTEMNFYPTEVGENRVQLFVKDNYGREEPIELVYNSEYSPFAVTSSTSSDEFLIANENAFSLNITRDSQTSQDAREAELFEMVYTISGGVGAIYEAIEATSPSEEPLESESRELESGKPHELFKGISGLTYKPETLGEHTITMDITAPDGATQREVIIVNAINTDYNFSAIANETQLFVTETTVINFDLAQVLDNPQASYEIAYSFSEGQGRLSKVLEDGSEKVLSAGVYEPITLGASSWKFTPTDVVSTTIEFIIRDNSNNIKPPEAVTVTTLVNDYTIRMSVSSNEEIVNTRVPITATLTELAENSTDTYKAYVISSSRGQIYYNGITYNLGEEFDIIKGYFAFDYLGLEDGGHGLTLHVVSSSNVNKQSQGAINYTQVDTNLIVNPEKTSITEEEEIAIDFTIEEITGRADYKLRYTITGANGIFTDVIGTELTSGLLYEVSKPTFRWYLKGTQTGRAVINFTVESNTGFTTTRTLNIEITKKDFNLTVTPLKTTAFVNEQIQATVNITEIGVGGNVIKLSSK